MRLWSQSNSRVLDARLLRLIKQCTFQKAVEHSLMFSMRLIYYMTCWSTNSKQIRPKWVKRKQSNMHDCRRCDFGLNKQKLRRWLVMIVSQTNVVINTFSDFYFSLKLHLRALEIMKWTIFFFFEGKRFLFSNFTSSNEVWRNCWLKIERNANMLTMYEFSWDEICSSFPKPILVAIEFCRNF